MDRMVNECVDNGTTDSRAERWYRMPLSEQMLNVGSEVHRAIRWKNRHDRVKSENFCNKAIEFLRIMQTDPRNDGRVSELESGIAELEDFFCGDNLYGTSDEVLIRYYDSFMWSYGNYLEQSTT